MALDVNIQIDKIIANIRISEGRSDAILAFAELQFFKYGEFDPIFKVRGIVIRKTTLQSGQQVDSVSFPAFGSPRSKAGFQTSFIIQNSQLFESVRKFILDNYYQEINKVDSVADVPKEEKPDDADELLF